MFALHNFKIGSQVYVYIFFVSFEVLPRSGLTDPLTEPNVKLLSWFLFVKGPLNGNFRFFSAIYRIKS